METISNIVLAVASLFAAILLYRQSNKLTAQSKIDASLITLCCVFICSSAMFPLFVKVNGEQSSTFLLMLDNLHQFLALPLLCSIVLSIKLSKGFTKGTWGRWSLALIASFELCRRAQVGDYYADSITLICLVILSFCVFYKLHQATPVTVLIHTLALASFGSASLVFNSNPLIDDFSNAIAYNFSLSLALILLCWVINPWLDTEESTG